MRACFISLLNISFPLETPWPDNVNWCTLPPLWHSYLWFCSQAKKKGKKKVKWTPQRAVARHQWVFALFDLFDLEQNKTVNVPTSGSKYLSTDLTTVVLWIMKEFAPCQETALTSKRHQNEAPVKTSSQHPSFLQGVILFECCPWTGPGACLLSPGELPAMKDLWSLPRPPRVDLV